MADVVFVGFDSFVEALAEGAHILGTNTLRLALTNVAPTAATDTQFSDITEIAAGNGYTAGGIAFAVTSSTQTAGVYNLVITSDLTWTASGGPIAQFRYLVAYDDTATNDELIGYYDTGAAVDVLDGDPYTFASSGVTLLTLQAA